MRGSQKSKRVSWAADVNLRQVKLFLSEDSPSQVGLGAQDHLQAKTSWLLHSTAVGSDDNLPPGFEGAHTPSQLKNELSKIPLIKWICPPRFILNPHWRVVAGEESEEVNVQNQREMRVLEAVYPRPSAIPPSPSVSMDVENCHYDDNNTLQIPITPIEDEDVADTSSELLAPCNIPINLQPQIMPQVSLASGNLQSSQCSAAPKPPGNEKPLVITVPGVEPDVVAAASAAFTAIMRSNEQGSLIDPDLLIKILSNPNLIEKLVTDHGTATNTQTIPKPKSPPTTSLGLKPSPPLPVHFGTLESNAPMSTAPPSGHLYPVATGVAPTLNTRSPSPVVVPLPSAPAVKNPPVKDINYYKSLIQQHGEERREAQEQAFAQFGNRHQNQNVGVRPELLENPKPRDLKPKIQKPCIYFNSSRGCRHGANCSYLHDSSFQQRVGSIPEAQSAKRMKLDREITGRT